MGARLVDEEDSFTYVRRLWTEKKLRLTFFSGHLGLQGTCWNTLPKYFISALLAMNPTYLAMNSYVRSEGYYVRSEEVLHT